VGFLPFSQESHLWLFTEQEERPMNKQSSPLRNRYRYWFMQRLGQQPDRQPSHCHHQPAPITLYRPGNQAVVTWIVNGQVR